MKFSDDNKQVNEFSGGNWFGFGVHKVKIMLIENGGTGKDEKEYVEVTVVGNNGEEETARVWFTTDKAANYSFNVLRQIYVHNAPEPKKDEARTAFDALTTSDELVELMQKCVGGECWFTKYESPDRTYTNQAGETKKSIDKNIMGYEPKLREDLIRPGEPKDKVHDVTDEDLENTDTGPNVPSKW